jgi:hypothetical protein
MPAPHPLAAKQKPNHEEESGRDGRGPGNSLDDCLTATSVSSKWKRFSPPGSTRALGVVFVLYFSGM